MNCAHACLSDLVVMRNNESYWSDLTTLNINMNFIILTVNCLSKQGSCTHFCYRKVKACWFVNETQDRSDWHSGILKHLNSNCEQQKQAQSKFWTRGKNFSVKMFTCRDGPIKRMETRLRWKRTRRLPHYRNMVEKKKTQRLPCICCARKNFTPCPNVDCFCHSSG